MSRRKISILAIDGGGIRGIIPARVLQAVEETVGRPVAELFDLVAGTSTGGIIALGLTAPAGDGSGPLLSAADLVELNVDHGETICGKPARSAASSTTATTCGPSSACCRSASETPGSRAR
jgi:patatin-like phospholipase/acyl hydrolase